VNRVASYLLLCVFLALGTGAAEYVHNLQHAAEDAKEDAIAAASGHPSQEHHHDESNCAVHAQLHMPFVAVGWVPILLTLGLLLALLSLSITPLIPRMLPVRVDCRGPPVCYFH
jgi:hypothetical protein